MTPPRLVSAVVALAFVFTPAVLFAAGVRPEAFENRPLAPAPSASDGWDALDAVPPWATDHLPGRERAVRTKSWVDYVVLGMIPPQSTPPGGRPTIATPDGPEPAAPPVVMGRDAELFLGADFDRTCTNGPAFRSSLEAMTDLTRTIERSGRRVVLTVVPNKSSVTADLLPRVLPHGRCAEQGIARQNRILDDFADPHYLPLRRELADLHADGRQVYWRDDTHWTSVGSAVFERRLAERLDPELAAGLRFTDGEHTQVGDLMKMAGLDFEETAPTEDLDTGATVTLESSSDPVAESRQMVPWTTTPTTHTLPGRTALIGDSFTFTALDDLRPLFASGDFQWLAYVTPDDVVRRIVDADTVVLTVVQRNVAGSLLADPGFGRTVRDALRHETLGAQERRGNRSRVGLGSGHPRSEVVRRD